MKNKLLSLTILLLFSIRIIAQEQIVMTTDRTIYIGGEDIWLTISNFNTESSMPSNLSRVAYVELLNQANVPILQEKLYLSDGMATAKLTVPDTVSTGNYLLRAYSKWMRNFSPNCFESTVVSIVNPFASNSLPEKMDSPINQRVMDEATRPSASLTNLQKVYSTRQSVHLTIDVEEQDWQWLGVSIVKSCLYQPNKSAVSANSMEGELNKDPLLLPEHNGEIIEGTITDLENGHPVVGEKMMLSFVGQQPVLKFSTTDSTGAFIFEVNSFGEQELVIQPYSPDTAKLNYKVTLKDAYSGQYADLNVPDLIMDSITIKEINRAIVNMQINTIYSSFLPDVAMADSIQRAEAFYGQPEKTILIDKYIELPNMEEVIREIVPFVYLRKADGEYYVKVYEDQSLYPSEGKTMTFVDGVPVSDFSRILEMAPSYIDRIEVLNLNYYYQDENLGRLLMFFTREGDMGNMEFDNRLFRQVHNGYLNSYRYASPDYTDVSRRNSRLADYRNTLYFASYKGLKDKKQINFEFSTGDDVSEYTLILTGINKNGTKETILESFKVE
ncbi:hypothetical protein [Carboxylicivirga taeanensis]|uniref:hypothetical protein n=1 Tax=Carboxylicivirga taeanensis TaxID=1416875 RepID=UPI003F6E22DD